MSDSHPCARCATMQRTCCEETEILVTEGDVARIAAHTGRNDFHHFRAPTDPSYLEVDPEDPDWRDLTVRPDGTRHVLLRRPDMACGFLGTAGCSLPETVRPLVCRLYPWRYTARGLVGEAAEYCPVLALAPPLGSIALLLGMTPAIGERWRAQLYEELGAGVTKPAGGLTCVSA